VPDFSPILRTDMKQISTKFLGFILLGGLLFLAACGVEGPEKVTVYQDFQKTGWHYRDSIPLTVNITDTTLLYKLTLTLDADEKYPFRNLYLKFNVVQPDKRVTESLTDLVLADASGKWNVEKSMGGVYHFEQVLSPKMAMSKKGDYTVMVKQFMRLDTLVGIRGIGMTMEPIENPAN
jgi:gliding motility-associated lipoprotein GldH